MLGKWGAVLLGGWCGVQAVREWCASDLGEGHACSLVMRTQAVLPSVRRQRCVCRACWAPRRAGRAPQAVRDPAGCMDLLAVHLRYLAGCTDLLAIDLRDLAGCTA